MDYCLVESGQLMQGPMRLPKSWRNVSGLNLSSTAELKEKGWLPAVIVEPEFNKATHKRGARSVSIGTDDVTFTYATEHLIFTTIGITGLLICHAQTKKICHGKWKT